jgi:hypothetical protein
VTPVPESWRGKHPARDPLREPRPRTNVEPVQRVEPDPSTPAADTARRVESERNLFNEALAQLGGRLRRRAR